MKYFVGSTLVGFLFFSIIFMSPNQEGKILPRKTASNEEVIATSSVSDEYEAHSTDLDNKLSEENLNEVFSMTEEESGDSVINAKGLADLLTKQKFTCNTSSVEISKRGILCQGLVAGYPRNVRIYIPANYTGTIGTKINYFFHGHRLAGVDTFKINPGDTKGSGDFGARLAESQSKDLLVIPESIGNCATYEVRLYHLEEFQNFLSNIEKLVGLDRPKFSLSGHSGAGRVLNILLSHVKNLKIEDRLVKVGYYDAFYHADYPYLTDLVKRASSIYFTVAYVYPGGTTKGMGSLSPYKNKIVVKVVPGKNGVISDHMNVMNNGGFSQFLAK